MGAPKGMGFWRTGKKLFAGVGLPSAEKSRPSEDAASVRQGKMQLNRDFSMFAAFYEGKGF
jgi:hypothetical protein